MLGLTAWRDVTHDMAEGLSLIWQASQRVHVINKFHKGALRERTVPWGIFGYSQECRRSLRHVNFGLCKALGGNQKRVQAARRRIAPM